VVIGKGEGDKTEEEESDDLEDLMIKGLPVDEPDTPYYSNSSFTIREIYQVY